MREQNSLSDHKFFVTADDNCCLLAVIFALRRKQNSYIVELIVHDRSEQMTRICSRFLPTGEFFVAAVAPSLL